MKAFGPLEEKDATLGDTTVAPTTVVAALIFTIGELPITTK